MPVRLDTPVQFLKGVGPRRAEAFARLGVRTAEDLVYHVPFRYLDATDVTPIARADIGQEVTVVGRIVSKGVFPTRRRLRIFRAVLRDDTGLIECAWPGQAFLDRSLREGQLVLVTGVVKYYHGRQLNPREHVVLSESREDDDEGGQGLVLPVYSATEGLTHRQIRRVVGDHLDAILDCVEDSAPPALLEQSALGSLRDSLAAVHRPNTVDDAERGRRRLALENDSQAVFMAPTELLAEQHGDSIARLLAPVGLVPEMLVGKMTAREKEAVRGRIADGDARIVVGTHALFQDQTAFRRLGLVVIDEQHRFGVEQRAALIEKGDAPDVLLLTATPIPRTLALTLYGDLDVSELRQKPAGRLPVKTTLRSGRDRKSVYEFITNECESGRRAFIVYPIIEESEKVDLKAATTMAAQVEEAVAPYRVGLVHGRMRPDERDIAMRAFRDGELSVLVATTVIEVGIDVPAATMMVIEHPERFGMAQLHQLRGRVGRATEQSYCVLIAERGARDRLLEFARTTDGFEIAELDLKERGMGTLAGARQSGGMVLRYTDLERDGDLVRLARQVALDIVRDDPTLAMPAHQKLRERIERRHARGMELFRVG